MCETPYSGGNRVLRVAEAHRARRSAQGLPGWSAILLKAYAITASRHPQLRQSFLPWPWPRLFEQPYSVCAVVTEREWMGEEMVFIEMLLSPETMSLVAIQKELDKFRKAPIESISGYRRILRFSKLPRFLRVFAMRLGYSIGAFRTRYFGTFAVNSLGHPRTKAVQSMGWWTMTIFHSVPDREGNLSVDFFFDHRVLDGMGGNRPIGVMESVINGEIAAELRAIAESREKQSA